jgi:tetratricopeptide (TPR) repeat protein
MQCSNKYRYLYERENYDTAQYYLEASINTFSDRTSLSYASAIDLCGLIELDVGHPHDSLKYFEEAFNLRKAALPEDDPFLAANFVNYGLAFTEIGDLNKARDYLQKSIDIRLKAKSDRIGNSYSNMASLLLRMDKPDEAEDMLKSCPSLANFTDETFLKTGNPRFSG